MIVFLKKAFLNSCILITNGNSTKELPKYHPEELNIQDLICCPWGTSNVWTPAVSPRSIPNACVSPFSKNTWIPWIIFGLISLLIRYIAFVSVLEAIISSRVGPEVIMLSLLPAYEISPRLIYYYAVLSLILWMWPFLFKSADCKRSRLMTGPRFGSLLNCMIPFAPPTTLLTLPIWP